MENAIKVTGLTKHYSGFELTDISFSLPRGTVMGFIGRNGAGKTTTIKLIMGLIHKDAGSIEVLGKEMGPDSADIRQNIGFVYDEQAFYGGIMTARDVGKMTGRFYKEWNKEEFYRLLKNFNLDPEQKTEALSRGQRTKLSIALALSHNAELLIMDEPSSGLDPVFRNEFIDILYRIIQDEHRSILFSTHITSDLEKIADYITLIDNGRVVFSDAKDEILDIYKIVKGSLNRLDEKGRGMCVAVHEMRTGFEALSASADKLAALLGADAVTQRATIEDIMVYTVKEGSKWQVI
ncbi:MAG: ABC transporter ATP-binding protein [Deltaproteobacteria bacterium]|nr:ABC transporter ATP-binding protein [Deltaproteobacteria bacterium]